MARVEILEYRGKASESPLGRHLIAELYNCDPKILRDPAEIKRVFLRAAIEAGMHVVTYNFHHFRPHGVSGMVIVSESHLSIHTWPEHRYAAVDIYVCGGANPWDAYKIIFEGLKAENATAMEIKRGIIMDIRRGAGEVD